MRRSCFLANGSSGHMTGIGIWISLLREKTGLEFSLHDLRRTYITIAEVA